MFPRLVTAIVILALICPPTWAQDSPARLRHSAMQALADHDYQEAERLLQTLAAENPRNVSYLFDLTEAQRQLGKIDEALETLGGLLKIDPHHEPAVTLTARILAEKGDWQGIIKLLAPQATSTESYHLSHLLAEAYRQTNQLLEAAWYYDRAIRLNPEAVQDFVELAKLHLRRGLPALAVRALESALALAVEDLPTLDTHSAGQVHYLLAKAYHQAGRPLGKIEIMPVARAIPGNLHGEWYVLEAVEDQPNRYRVCPSNSAIYHLHKAFALGFDEPGIHLLSADIWFNANQYERARDIYEMIQAAVPTENLADYHYRYGMTLYWLDDLQGFQQHIETASELDPQTYKPKLLEAHTLLADRFCIHGNLDQYIRHLELGLEAAPRSVELRYKLGNALHEADRRGEAAAHWQAVLQLDPHHPDRERLLKLLNYEDLASPPQPQSSDKP